MMSGQELAASDFDSDAYNISLPGSGRRGTFSRLTDLFLPLLLLAIFPFLIYPFDFMKPYGPIPLRIFLTLCIFTPLFLFRKSAWVIIPIIFYMATQALWRRALIPWMGVVRTDPLLLIGATLSILYFLEVALSRKLKFNTTTAKLRLALIIIMVLEIFNPKQGGVTVGLGGVFFILIPVLWSFAGRELGNEKAMPAFLWTIVLIGMAGALYGLKQTFYGLSSFETLWLNSQNTQSFYTANGTVRTFSFFTAGSEYGIFLVVAIVTAVALAVRCRQPIALLSLPLLGTALFYTSERTPVVMALFGIVLVWAVQGKTVASWVPRLILASLIGVSGLVYGLRHAQSDAVGSSQDSLIQHQAQGLLDPAHSSAAIHAGAVQMGIIGGIKSIVGGGLGITTLAGAKWGNGNANSENDISNMFISLGWGGFLYIAFIISAMGLAFRIWLQTRSVTGIFGIAILSVCLGGWLNGDNYSIVMLCWLVIGMLERQNDLLIAARQKAAASGNPAYLQAGS